MRTWQQLFLLLFATLSLLVSIKGFYESKYKKNAYGLTPVLFLLGIFVWGDAVVFGLFWFFSSIVSIITKDWVLFLLIISTFWLVRSFGETVYWLNQQFSSIDRNPPKKMLGYSIFQNDSIWFIYQILHQVIAILSMIFTIYFANLWLKGGL